MRIRHPRFHTLPLLGLEWTAATRTLSIHLLSLSFEVQWRRRVLCSKPPCRNPAVMCCVHWDGWGTSGNRDPLCQTHGKSLGVCPDDTWGEPAKKDKHIPIQHPYTYRGEDWNEQ